MAFQISHGLTDCVHYFLRRRINVAVEKIRGEAISNILVLQIFHGRTATCASTSQLHEVSVI